MKVSRTIRDLIARKSSFDPMRWAALSPLAVKGDVGEGEMEQLPFVANFMTCSTDAGEREGLS